MEKEDSTNWEFVVPAKLKELYAKQDYAPYGSPEQGMPVAFTANTHTTGGNSGSPVMNARGELIGINFDRNWEGVGATFSTFLNTSEALLLISGTFCSL